MEYGGIHYVHYALCFVFFCYNLFIMRDCSFVILYLFISFLKQSGKKEPRMENNEQQKCFELCNFNS